MTRGQRWPAALLAVTPLACAAVGPGAGGEPPRTPPSSAARISGELRPALERALDGGEAGALRLFTECYQGDEFLTLELFGRGVGIWNNAREFRPGSSGIVAAVEELLAAGFPEMAASYGGAADRRKPPAPQPEGAGPVRLVCAVEASAGGVGKRVEQLAGGERHEPLLELGGRLLSRWRAAGEAGIGAADLDDGLAKLARGALSPETLELSLHEKPAPAENRGGGFLLRLHGRQLTARAFEPGSGYGPPRTATLGPEELERLAARLAELAPGRLPVNLWAPGYLDLTIELLDHRLSVQARRFAGMTRETHGAAQRELDRLLDELRALYRRVATAPQRSPDPPPPDC